MNNSIRGAFHKKEASFLLQVSGIVGDSIVDGPGLRVSIFCQGCPHACAGCHNPATHPFNGGTFYSTEELFSVVQRFPLCRAVTLSGGEPFCQTEALLPLAKKLRAENYSLAAYTGYTFEALLKMGGTYVGLLAELDILIDGPFVLAKRNLSLRFRGSENQRILDVPQSLAQQTAVCCTQKNWIGENI